MKHKKQLFIGSCSDIKKVGKMISTPSTASVKLDFKTISDNSKSPHSLYTKK
jgi:hypothetical protein